MVASQVAADGVSAGDIGGYEGKTGGVKSWRAVS